MQVLASAIAAHVVRNASRTALYIASTTGDVELRVRQLVRETLVLQWHLYTEGGSVQPSLLPQFLRLFPACAYKSAQSVLADQPEIRTQLEAMRDALQDDTPPLWLAQHVASCIVSSGHDSLSYELDCCMRQLGAVRTWSAADATQLLTELTDKLRSPDPCAEVLDPRCAFFCEETGVGLFYSRRPLSGDVFACDERLGLVAVDGVQQWIGAGWTEKGQEVSLLHQRRVADFGFMLQHISAVHSLPVLVTNSVRRPRELHAACAQGGTGLGTVQGEEDGEMEGQVEAPAVGKLASLPADELLRRFYTPSLGPAWSSIARMRVLLLSLPETAGVAIPFVTVKVGEEPEEQTSTTGLHTLASAVGLPSTLYGLPVSCAKVGVQEVCEVACRDATARVAVALKGPAGTPTHVGIIFSLPSDGVTLMPTAAKHSESNSTSTGAELQSADSC